MSNTILKVEHITKKYGSKTALSDVGFTIEQGKIYGFIGENGAGKTTMIRAITGLTKVTEGTIELFGASDQRGLEQARTKMGCLVERPILSLNQTAWENLNIQQKLFGKKEDDTIQALLERVGLGDVTQKKVRDFSLGMKQRLGIAMALVNRPEFLVLDEPVNGLDPMGMIDVRELLRSLCKEDGITILISSHILAELYQLVTDYIMISDGRIIEEISKSELDRRCAAHILVETERMEEAVEILKRQCGISQYECDGNIVRIYDSVAMREVAEALFHANILVTQLTQIERSLEEYYIELLGRRYV